MGEDARAIERQIEQTREHMGETVQALANKADVPGRMRRYVGEKREAVVSTVSGAREVVYGSTESVSEAGHDLGDKAMGVGHEAGRQARRAGGVARENPVGLAVGAAAVGFPGRHAATAHPVRGRADRRAGRPVQRPGT